ncbi:MAG: aminopeptidase P N-terminal domain-containing protein [Planctomycetota bacterium]
MFEAHRTAFFERMAERSVALFGSGRLKVRSNDVHYRFRPHSDLYYLCGFQEPDAFLVLRRDGAERRVIMFVLPRSAESELWNGPRQGPDGAKAGYGADEAHESGELSTLLPQLLQNLDTLYYALGTDPELDDLVVAAWGRARAATRDRGGLPRAIVHPGSLLDELRLIKDTDELDRMRHAAAITVAAHRAAIAACEPGRREYEIEALIDHLFRCLGATAPAYPTIVAGGPNAATLHYAGNGDLLRGGDLVLIDAGAEYQGYASDITRTLPVSGHFTEPQHRLYDLVLKAQEAAIATVRPGSAFDVPHRVACRILVEGLIELDILHGDVEELLEAKALQPFFMHRTSHWLGIDVHDAGAWRIDGEGRELRPGMVLTIEPGLYLGESPENVPAAYRGIGIRIEDNVLVTPTGHEILTAALPKKAAEIEALCRAPLGLPWNAR